VPARRLWTLASATIVFECGRAGSAEQVGAFLDFWPWD
jgi:hypothetical protein